MTTPDKDKSEQLIKLAVELDEQLKSKSDVSLPSHADLPSDDSTSLSNVEIDELNRAGEALSFLEQVREDFGLLGISPNESTDTQSDSLFASPASQGNSHETFFEFDENVDAPSNQQFGRFKIIEAVGEGGFARVFRANDPWLDREVALKIPRPQVLASDESRTRFVREGKAAAMLSHPGIVAVFEAGAMGPINYLACEYVAGENLAAWFSRQKVAGIFEAAAIVKRIAEAVHHAHQRGVVHRDLKPSNILIENGDAEFANRIRVADFGLAKDLSEKENVDLTMEGAVVGTPAYMSPEQIRCDPDVGVATDIYSMGVILYELLTGAPPHKKSGISATIRAVEFDAVRPIRKSRADVSVELDAICQKCLEKVPDARYSSAFELATDLDCFLKGMPVSAKPPGPLDRLNKYVKRNPVIASCLAVAFFALASGGIASWLMYRQAEGDRLTAVEANVEKTAALKLAETRLAEMHQQMDLMTSVFDEIKSHELGDTTSDLMVESLGENLVLAAERIFESSSDPSLRSNMAARIGRSLGRIGFSNDSFEITQRALELGRKKNLKRSEILVLELCAADGLANRSKLADVIDAMAPIVDEILESSVIRDHEKFSALGVLAYAYHNSGQPELASETYQLLVDFHDRLGSEKIGSVGRSQVAEPTLRKGQSYFDSRAAKRVYATALFQIATNRYRQNKNDENLEGLLKSRDRVEEVLGGNDWGTIGVSYSTADALREAGRTTEAMELAESALENSIDSFGKDGFQTIMTINTLAITCATNLDNPKCKKRLPEVLAMGQQACANRLKGNAYNLEVFKTFGNIAKCCELSGDLEKCVSARRELLKIARENKLDPKTIQDQVFELGMMLAKNNEHEEAVQHLNSFVAAAKTISTIEPAQVKAAKKMIVSMDNCP